MTVHPLCFAAGMILSGFTSVLVDRYIRQTIIEPSIENDHLPQACKYYRRTKIHIVSLFILGMIVFIVMFSINKVLPLFTHLADGSY